MSELQPENGAFEMGYCGCHCEKQRKNNQCRCFPHETYVCILPYILLLVNTQAPHLRKPTSEPQSYDGGSAVRDIIF